MSSVQWKPELWVPLHIGKARDGELLEGGVPPVKSFLDSQKPEETYEVRGILPRACITSTD